MKQLTMKTMTTQKKKYKVLHPMNFGLPSDYELIFEQTKRGYKAELPVSADGTWNWIGMPTLLIENTTWEFEEIIPKPKRERVKAVLIKPKHK